LTSMMAANPMAAHTFQYVRSLDVGLVIVGLRGRQLGLVSSNLNLIVLATSKSSRGADRIAGVEGPNVDREPRGATAISNLSRVHDAVCNAICRAGRHRSIPTVGKFARNVSSRMSHMSFLDRRV
jgi:hypothetical protein